MRIFLRLIDVYTFRNSVVNDSETSNKLIHKSTSNKSSLTRFIYDYKKPGKHPFFSFKFLEVLQLVFMLVMKKALRWLPHGADGYPGAPNSANN